MNNNYPEKEKWGNMSRKDISKDIQGQPRSRAWLEEKGTAIPSHAISSLLLWGCQWNISLPTTYMFLGTGVPGELLLPLSTLIKLLDRDLLPLYSRLCPLSSIFPFLPCHLLASLTLDLVA